MPISLFYFYNIPLKGRKSDFDKRDMAAMGDIGMVGDI
jgi:hypothetical protein